MNIELTESGWKQAVLLMRWVGLGIRSAVQLAPSAYIALAAGAASMLLDILLQRLHNVLDKLMTLTTMAWNKATESADGVPAVQPITKIQKLWDDLCCKAASLDLTNTACQTSFCTRMTLCIATRDVWSMALCSTHKVNWPLFVQ